jgi:hypothetical protein
VEIVQICGIIFSYEKGVDCAFFGILFGGRPKFGGSKLQILSFRVIGSYQSLRYILNKRFPAFPSLQRCFCHVQNRNTHSYKISGLWLSATVTSLSFFFCFFLDKFDFGLIYFTCSTSEILCNIQYISGTGDIYITANTL